MKVLSLFDGISCGMVALERAGIPVERYVAYEIDKNAIKISEKNYPMIEHRGDVTTADFTEFKDFDLVMGGSPCQDISHLKKGALGLKGSKSGLFYHFLRALEEVEPKYFLLENVCGKKDAVNEITELLGVLPKKINSSYFSAQNRNRYYWTNINIRDFQDKNISLEDILQPDELVTDCFLKDGRLKWLMGESGQNAIKKRYVSINGKKSQCLTARSEGSWNCQYIEKDGIYRHLSPIEYERLQTLPDGYTEGISNSNRYKCLGNGWTVDVIAHILKGILEMENKEV